MTTLKLIAAALGASLVFMSAAAQDAAAERVNDGNRNWQDPNFQDQREFRRFRDNREYRSDRDDRNDRYDRDDRFDRDDRDRRRDRFDGYNRRRGVYAVPYRDYRRFVRQHGRRDLRDRRFRRWVVENGRRVSNSDRFYWWNQRQFSRQNDRRPRWVYFDFRSGRSWY